jgi:hypothetical protein
MPAKSKAQQNAAGTAPAEPTDGAGGGDSLADASDEAVAEIERRDDGSGGNAGRGDGG